MGTTSAYPSLHSAEHLLTGVLQRRLPAMSDFESRFKSRKCVFEFDCATLISQAEIVAIEQEVQSIIDQAVAVTESYIPRSRAGYLSNLHQVPIDADPVRVVRIGPYDERACVGQHVAFTHEIHCFRITSFRSAGPGRYRLNFVVN
jgi:misacylated tRNA(Ala) deacylase